MPLVHSPRKGESSFITLQVIAKGEKFIYNHFMPRKHLSRASEVYWAQEAVKNREKYPTIAEAVDMLESVFGQVTVMRIKHGKRKSPKSQTS